MLVPSEKKEKGTSPISYKTRNRSLSICTRFDMVVFWKVSWPYLLTFSILFICRSVDLWANNGKEKSEFHLYIRFLCCIRKSVFFPAEKWVKIKKV